MANLNKVMLIGRLTRDPEVVPFSNGGKVAKIGFAVNNRKKNSQTNQWEDVPVFLDVEAFNHDTGRKLADLVEQHLHKGNQVFIEGHLQLDQWLDKKDGSKRSKLKIVMDNLQFLEPRSDMAEDGSPRPMRSSGPASPRSAGPARGNFNAYSEPAPEPDRMEPPEPTGDNDTNIPF